MGCGGSKAAKVAPSSQPADAEDVAEQTQHIQSEQETATEEKKPAPKTKRRNSNKIAPAVTVDEDVSTKKSSERAAHSARSYDSGIIDDTLLQPSQEKDRINSATSTQSAPQILERPKSRGGFAFEVVYDDVKTPRPARLKSLEHPRLKASPVLADLDAKLRAAERRRKERQNEVKKKMASETSKVSQAHSSLKREKTTIEERSISSVDQAAENRERHLKQLQAKLKAKEERAAKVRANKERLLRERQQQELEQQQQQQEIAVA